MARLRYDLLEFIDEDEILVFDIMQPPGKLTKSEQRRKLVIVAKKQAKNLERIIQSFDTDYPDLKGRHTSRDVQDRLYTINEFENTLRTAFESGAHEKGVVFIQADANNRVRPWAPNKVLLSNVVAVRPSGLYLPTGFKTRPDVN